MKQCAAITLSSTYAPAHRCLKTSGLKKIDGRPLCAHHRAAAAPRRPDPSSARRYTWAGGAPQLVAA